MSSEQAAGSDSARDDCKLPCWLETTRRFFFGTISPSEKRKGLEVERALSVLRGLSTIGFIVTFFYGLSAGGFGGACIAALGGAAAFAMGGFLGFLFGLPRWTEVNTGTQPQGQPASGKSQPAGQPAPTTTQARNRAIQPNTNLERIMDWLTTLIVGLGLVHWEPALKHGTETSVWFTRAIYDAPGYMGNGSPGAAIIGAFTAAGFMLVYLWAGRYMGEEMARADRDSRLEEAQQALKEEKEEHAKTSEKLVDTTKRENKLAEVASAIVQPGAAAMQVEGAALRARTTARDREHRFEISELDTAARRLKLSHPVVEEIRKRYRQAKGYYDEPLDGFGPAEAAGFRLEADVRDGEFSVYTVTLRVVDLRNTAKSMSGYVAFFLHHTLPECIRAVEGEPGKVEINLVCSGSFIAGAVVADEDVRLSLDLARLPGVPKDFIDN